MRKLLLVVAVIVGLIGLVWFGQGIGVIGGSFMTNDSKWAIIGGIMAVAAVGILLVGTRRARTK